MGLKRAHVFAASLLSLFFLWSSAVYAEANPIEISAQESLEWNRQKKTYAAIGQVEARQGNVRLVCDKLIATYQEKDTSTDITQLSAFGDVIVTAPVCCPFSISELIHIMTIQLTC